MNAIIAGQVDYICAPVALTSQLVQSGTVKAYAIGSAERNPILPNVPTATEAGLPEFRASFWIALFAPKETPRPILDKLTGQEKRRESNTQPQLFQTRE